MECKDVFNLEKNAKKKKVFIAPVSSFDERFQYFGSYCRCFRKKCLKELQQR